MEDPAAAGGAPGEEPAPEVPGAEGGEAPGEEATEIHSGDTVTISKVEPPDPEAEEPPMGGEAPGGEAPGGEAPGAEAPPMEEDIDLNELLASLNEEGKKEEENMDEGKKKEEEGYEEESKKMDEVKSALNEAIADRDEAYKTVQYLKTQINEINLLNAKLLYTNKLFKEFGMNRDQKVKVVEAFDLTKNVREVKMTYANWCESLNFGGKAQRKPGQQPASNVTMVTEGMASKPVASTKPKQIITESNDMAERFKKLAGIKPTKK
jgi:hypothetical protein